VIGGRTVKIQAQRVAAEIRLLLKVQHAVTVRADRHAAHFHRASLAAGLIAQDYAFLVVDLVRVAVANAALGCLATLTQRQKTLTRAPALAAQQMLGVVQVTAAW